MRRAALWWGAPVSALEAELRAAVERAEVDPRIARIRGLWTSIGTTAPVCVPVGDTLVVSDALVWPAADIPGTGHYCFVGILDHAADPAPVLPSPTDWDGFRSFIRNQNNVSWRRFNVLDDIEDPAADPWIHEFMVANFPKSRRYFDFVIERLVPRDVQVTLDLPVAIAGPFAEGTQIDWKLDETRQQGADTAAGRAEAGGAAGAASGGCPARVPDHLRGIAQAR